MESPDGEENYPGNLTLTVTYSWSEDNEIGILYEAASDQDTILNVTNHTYFNLDGHTSNNILNQKLLLHASNYTPVRAGSIPTGEIASVKGTPFDFTEWKTIGEEIDDDLIEEIFSERCNIPVTMKLGFKEPSESRYAKESEMILEQKVHSIMERIRANEPQPVNGDDMAFESAIKSEPRKEKSEEKKSEKAPAKQADKKPAKSYATKTPKSNNPNMLYGRDFEDDEVTPIEEIIGGIGDVVIKGQIFEMEIREIRDDLSLITFSVTDFTDSISAKIICSLIPNV